MALTGIIFLFYRLVTDRPMFAALFEPNIKGASLFDCFDNP